MQRGRPPPGRHGGLCDPGCGRCGELRRAPYNKVAGLSFGGVPDSAALGEIEKALADRGSPCRSNSPRNVTIRRAPPITDRESEWPELRPGLNLHSCRSKASLRGRMKLGLLSVTGSPSVCV